MQWLNSKGIQCTQLLGLLMPVALLFSLGQGKCQAAPPAPVTSGMKITAATRIKPGTYSLADNGKGIVQVSGSGFVVDFQGARIRGPGKGLGIGLHITDARNVTIKNADISGCLWGIVIERSAGVTLLDCKTSYNNDLPPGTVIDESGKEPEDQWGGGVLLRDSKNCRAQRCISQYQWDGIDVVRSEGNVIEDGDYSYNGNWGIHLWNSSKNTFRRNRAIWCTTGAGTLYQALTGWQTYDSQAVGIDHNSNENLIEGNDLRFGGDAIFIRANEGPITPGTVVPPRNGSHRNILRNNDCSFSPNNAIEVDLVDDTIIEGNNCSNSHYGMWLGYSRRCVIRNNICINDTAHAVEIENGQSDLFENNVFGWDTERPEAALVYLRQNGRDSTPSQGYVFHRNAFYGAGTGVLLRNTSATLERNDWNAAKSLPNRRDVKLVKEETSSQWSEAETNHRESTTTLPFSLDAAARKLKPGSDTTVRIPGAQPTRTVPIVEIDGIPAWVTKIGPGENVTFHMADDFWDQPEREQASLRVFSAGAWSVPQTVQIAWPASQPRISHIMPNPAKIGDTVTIAGANLRGGRLLLNNKPVRTVEASNNRLRFALPDGILIPTHYNLLWEKGAGESRVRTAPITFSVEVPREQMPHLVSADFEPKTLKVGDLLKVTMTLRNNLPTPARLSTKPAPPFTYMEKQASYEMGYSEQPGALHLRVTSDNTSPHNPGSWPYLFGFDKPTLAPGEIITVTGYIKMEHPGEREFRVGLVAGGFRFIDDNAFRTMITVTSE